LINAKELSLCKKKKKKERTDFRHAKVIEFYDPIKVSPFKFILKSKEIVTRTRSIRLSVNHS